MVTKLFKQSGYDVDKTEKAIIFLDGMGALGEMALNGNQDECDDQDPEEARREILQEIMGKEAKNLVLFAHPKKDALE